MFSLALAAAILLATGLVSGWGEWYSRHVAYRWQTDALLNGRLALANDPRPLMWDMVWTKGAIQQVWGLGVPLWRLPFEALARLLGQPAFPDRIAFGLALALLTYAVLRLFVVRGHGRETLAYIKRRSEAASAVFLLVLFPPFLTLCRTRFAVYEEAAAYSYLAGVGLFVGTLLFFRKPTLLGFAAVGLFAGLSGFMRPTLLAYGLASVTLAFLHTRRLRWRLWHSGLGAALFVLGTGFILLSNAHRFGSPFEFGHSLTLNTIDAMRFTTRFDHPFRSEPPLAAATELTSALFVAGDRFNGYSYETWYNDDIFPGQSDTHRWRELYFTTYDPSFALMLGILWGWALGQVARRGRARENLIYAPVASEVSLMACWSLLALIPTALFYLRAPVLASRYLLDFGPAFAVALTAFVLVCARYARRQFRSGRVGITTVLVATTGWWVWQVSSASVVAPGEAEFTPNQALMTLRSHLEAATVTNAKLPDAYTLGGSSRTAPFPFNASGWESRTGRTKAAVAFYVPPLRTLTVDVGPAEGVELTEADYDRVQAKVGLEFLEREAVKVTVTGRKLVFRGPKQQSYRKGFETAFLGFTTTEEVGSGDTPFRLIRVEWERIESPDTVGQLFEPVARAAIE